MVVCDPLVLLHAIDRPPAVESERFVVLSDAERVLDPSQRQRAQDNVERCFGVRPSWKKTWADVSLE